MLRHPPLQAASALFTRGGASLPSPVALLRTPGYRAMTATAAPAPAPRADVPLADHTPAPRAALPDGLVARCLARMGVGALRAEVVDDHRARRDPETRPFAAIPAPSPGGDTGTPARVAGPSDRPATAELPVIDLD